MRLNIYAIIYNSMSGMDSSEARVLYVCILYNIMAFRFLVAIHADKYCGSQYCVESALGPI